MHGTATERNDIVLRHTQSRELPAIRGMEQREATEWIIPYTLAKHREEFARQDVIYRSIHRDDRLVGFVILALDPDGTGVEFRRIVVAEPGRGIGTRAVELVGELCATQLGRERVWLDVFEANLRARHVYESCGYRPFGSAEHDGRRLLLYERTV